MAEEWRDPLSKAYQSSYDKIKQEAARLRASARHQAWSTGMESSSVADIGMGEIDKAYMDSLTELESKRAGEELSWMKYDQGVARQEEERKRREKAARTAGWWNLGGKVAGGLLSAIPGGGIWGNLARGVGSAVTGMPQQAFTEGEEGLREPGTPGYTLKDSMDYFGKLPPHLTAGYKKQSQQRTGVLPEFNTLPSWMRPRPR